MFNNTTDDWHTQKKRLLSRKMSSYEGLHEKSICLCCNHMSSVAETSFFCPKNVRFSNSELGQVADTNWTINWLWPYLNFSSIKWILILQKKAVRIINFQSRNSHTSPLFKQNFILKSQDKICLENILFVSKSLNNLSPIFNTWFSFSSDHH